MTWVWLALTGFMAGVFSGLFGIGGATIVVPVLVLGFGLGQHLAQGTTLAMMIPPIGLLAVWQYWKSGHVNFPWAIVLCSGFVVGGLIGAYFVNFISPDLLRKLFGVVFLLISLRLIFW